MKGEYEVNVFKCFELKYSQLKYWKKPCWISAYKPTMVNAMQKKKEKKNQVVQFNRLFFFQKHLALFYFH